MARPLLQTISLANKCLLLFGGAVILIVIAALAPAWQRMNSLVEQGEIDQARQAVAIWQRLDASAERRNDRPAPDEDGTIAYPGVRATPLTLEEAETHEDDFIRAALARFRDTPGLSEHYHIGWEGGSRRLRYARPIRRAAEDTDDETPGRLAGLILFQRQSESAAALTVVNTVYLFGAALTVLALALLVFYFITHRLILGPVRALKDTAERVRAGDLDTRSDISTGDEFQQLAETFNLMLIELQGTQERLRSINIGLDLKLNELAEANIALHDAAKLKGDFLANVSHELRTPMNSIVGFAELLLDIARQEADEHEQRGQPIPLAVQKRKRYLENIDAAARTLLSMIESLLEMAKIEAGRVELKIEPMNIRSACEGLIGLIHPLSSRKNIDVRLEVPTDLPLVHTDQKKFQQILFNFLSNAVKFIEPEDRTGRPGQITLRAERLVAASPDDPERLRISVIDTGPGIPPEEQQRIFEKFHQIDAAARELPGTGLGLAICKELAGILQGEIQLVSEVGRGSMFSLIIPVRLDANRAAETKLEQAFKGSLTVSRRWISS